MNILCVCMNKVKKIITILALSSIVFTQGCVFTDTGKNEQAVEVLAMSTVSQVVYTTVTKNPELAETYNMLITVLTNIDVSVDMTPEGISSKATEALKALAPEEYSFIVSGVIDALFTKYNIGWNESLDKEEIHTYLNDLIIAIDVAIDEYHAYNAN